MLTNCFGGSFPRNTKYSNILQTFMSLRFFCLLYNPTLRTHPCTNATNFILFCLYVLSSFIPTFERQPWGHSNNQSITASKEKNPTKITFTQKHTCSTLAFFRSHAYIFLNQFYLPFYVRFFAFRQFIRFTSTSRTVLNREEGMHVNACPQNS